MDKMKDLQSSFEVLQQISRRSTDDIMDLSELNEIESADFMRQ